MATPYQNIAKMALTNWNGLSEEEAIYKIKNESVQELEGQVYAMSSTKYAVIGIAKQVNLNEEETLKFLEATIYGPDNAEIFNLIGKKIQMFTDEQKLDVLSTIHDGWIVDNSNEKTFKKKVDRQQIRQYAPLDLIGWNEVKSVLLFLKPILEAIGVTINEKSLSQTYHKRVANYLDQMGINSQEDLTLLLQKGKKYYPILPEDLENRLIPMSEVIASQIIHNWQIKDLETYQIFINREKTQNTGIKL